MISVRRGLAYSGLFTVLKTVASFTAIMILARLLTPEEIGVFSVGMALIMLIQMMRSFGVGDYLVQEKDLTHERLRSAFGAVFLASWSLGVLLVACSGLIADFYDQPALRDVILILTISFFLLPFGSPAFMLLQRDMRFDLILRIRSGAMLIGPVVSVVLAYMGFSFYSMAWGQAAEQAAVVALTAVFAPKGFWVKPGLSEWRRVFSFGTKAMISQILDTVSFYMTDLILGRMLGFGPVGLYSRAMSLINLFQQRFMEAVNGVVLPAFARADRAREDLVPPFARAVSCLTGVAWPFYACTGLLAFPVVRVLFGDQWDASVPLVRVLCVGGAIFSVWAISRRVLTATGNIDQKLKATLMIQPAFIAAVIVGASYGLMAVTWAYVGMTVLGLVVHYTFLRRHVLHSLRPVVVAVARSIGPTIGSLIGPAAVVWAWGLEPADPVLALAVAVPTSAVGWLLGLMAARHPLMEEMVRAWKALTWRRFGRAPAVRDVAEPPGTDAEASTPRP